MDGLRTSGRDEGLAMPVACTDQGNLSVVRVVLLHLGTIFQDVLLLRADHLQLLLERRWNFRILRLVAAIVRSILYLITF